MAKSNGFYADADIKKYMTAMKIIDKRLLPKTVAETLNNTADAVAGRGKKNAQNRLTIRTKFTLNSIRQDRHARGEDIGRMYSRAGTISKYLPLQDEGGTVRAENKRIPIPTEKARTGKNPRKRIAQRYAMNSVQFGQGKFFMGRPKGGNRPLGIYERFQNNKRLRMIRQLEHSSVRVPASHWFSDAVKKYGTAQFIQAQFVKLSKRYLGIER